MFVVLFLICSLVLPVVVVFALLALLEFGFYSGNSFLEMVRAPITTLTLNPLFAIALYLICASLLAYGFGALGW